MVIVSHVCRKFDGLVLTGEVLVGPGSRMVRFTALSPQSGPVVDCTISKRSVTLDLKTLILYTGKMEIDLRTWGMAIPRQSLRKRVIQSGTLMS
jgi:hypothetical protein